MSVLPYVTGTAYTDGGRYQGDWQLDAMSPVLEHADTENLNGFGVVDSEGRVISLYPEEARTKAPSAPWLYSRGATGLVVTIVSTASEDDPAVTATIEGYDPASGTEYTILESAPIEDGSTTVTLTVYPTVATEANVSVATSIPDTVRVKMTHSDLDSITYFVTLHWIK